MTAGGRDGVAVIPSPLPAGTAARARMLDTLQRAALHVHEAAAPAPEPAGTSPRRLMFLDPGPSGEPVAAALSDPPPVELLLELSAETPAPRLQTWAQRIAAADVFWSLTTLSAMHMATPSRALAGAMVGVLAPQGGTTDLLTRVETALHETVANALVHGNLRLPSLCKLEGDDPNQCYDDAVAASLADRSLAHRRLEVSARGEAGMLRIAVSDEGDGVPDEHWQHSLTGGERALAHADKSGRGLYLTAMFCDDLNRSEDGRTVELCFRTDAVAA